MMFNASSSCFIDANVFRLCYKKLRQYKHIFKTCQCKSSLHRFFAELFLSVKAIETNLGSDKTLITAEKFKQWSDEAFNSGKEIEAIKRLTLHRFWCRDLPTASCLPKMKGSVFNSIKIKTCNLNSDTICWRKLGPWSLVQVGRIKDF